MTGFGDSRGERDEGVLAEALVGGEGFAIHAAGRCSNSETQAVQGVLAIRLKGRQENARGVISVAAGGHIAQAVVRYSVEDANGIVHPAFHDVARELKADVAAGNEQGREGALVEAGVVIGLEAFEADRRLELADAKLETAEIFQFSVGVVKDDCASTCWPKSGRMK